MSDTNTEHEVEQREIPVADFSPAAIFLGVVIISFAIWFAFSPLIGR